MTDETMQPTSWKEKLAQMWWSVKVGERAENLRQTARRFDNVDSLVMSTREKLLGKEIVDNNRPEGEDMHIGDYSSVTHQYLPPTGNAAGTLARLAVGAGLLATGIGVPVGGYLIADALRHKPSTTDEIVIPADQDTLFNLELVE
ncbi:hypothetical protein [Gimesia chilikensis]|uniref:hypothetical protein n=1 Tax=Gimesia chilikensis TaxID=2605989 RepID=UPI00118B0FCC|nr:hypothetical protein [Gimesia chilikensis]QDT88046.1 hypothetical protein MalM14_57410 [Gimesia chilikensis]